MTNTKPQENIMEIGDVVELASGGLPMTVIGTNEDGDYAIVAMYDEIGGFETHFIPTAALVTLDDDGDDGDDGDDDDGDEKPTIIIIPSDYTVK